jgi:polyisoprenoid-binding protein YceI
MKNICFFLLFIGLASSVAAQEVGIVKVFADKKVSSITYTMRHPLHTWDGTSKEVNSVILTNADKSVLTQVAVSVKLGSFDSKNANRDSHMIEVAEGLKYPIISFSSTSIQTQGDVLLVKGNVSFHGVTQPITFEAKRKTTGSNLEVSGAFTLKMTQFKIEPPSLLGVAADDVLKLKFKVVY